jgi:hypothetical protein
MIVPAAAADLVQDDSCEAMIEAHRPAARAGKARKRLADQLEPARLERNASLHHGSNLGAEAREFSGSTPPQKIS